MQYCLLALLGVSQGMVHAQSILATQCWYKSSNVIAISSGGPCGVVTPNSNFLSCCQPNDTCLTTSGLCHTNFHPAAPSNTTGYYIGGCTDSTFRSPSCSPACEDLAHPDVVFNQTTQTWLCCGADDQGIKCNDPTAEGFRAPRPVEQATTYTVPTHVATGSATSKATTTQPASTSTGSGSKPKTIKKKAGITGGAIGGIVVGAVAAVALLGALIWWLLRRQDRKADGSESGRTSKAAEMGQNKDSRADGTQGITTGGQIDVNGVKCAPGSRAIVQEKMADGEVLEAPGDNEPRHELA